MLSHAPVGAINVGVEGPARVTVQEARAALCRVLPSHLLPGPAVKPAGEGREGREGSSGLAEQAAARGDPGTAPTAGSSGLLCSRCQTPLLTPSHPEQGRSNPATIGALGSALRSKPVRWSLGHEADVLPRVVRVMDG